MLRFSHPLHLVLGLFLWAAWFVAAYGGLSVACAVAAPPGELGARTWINLALLLSTVVTSALLLFLAIRCWRARARPEDRHGQQRFVSQVAAGLYLCAAVSTLAVGLPVVVLPPCI